MSGVILRFENYFKKVLSYGEQCSTIISYNDNIFLINNDSKNQHSWWYCSCKNCINIIVL